MKILVIGGMHGNEPLGPAIVRLFQSKPIQGIDAVLANEMAVRQDCRFVTNDLNRSFPGDSQSNDYETFRAAELLDLTCKYDVVLDFHNTHCPKNDCGFVGDTAPEQLYSVSSWLGLKKVIVADYDCINKYAPNCLSVEISLNSPVMDVVGWYDKIARLRQVSSLSPASDIEKYRFVYRMTLADKERLHLEAQDLRAFTPIKDELAALMGVKNPAYPIFVGDAYTPYNYGGLLNKL